MSSFERSIFTNKIIDEHCLSNSVFKFAAEMNPNQDQNFLNPPFGPQITCSCTVEDFHGAENLISDDKQKLRRGFMAYRVIKPPIELEFQLCCPIELCSIRIWPKIDSLKSTGFEIFATNGDGLRPEFRKVASHFNLKENGIHFINDSIINMGNDGHGFAVTPFYSSARYQLRKVHTVKLIIKQTAKCVPVLERIEIWGRISRFASKEQKAKANEAIMKMNTSIESNKSVEDDEINTNCSDDTEKNDETDTPPSVDIPEVFLDAITYEIMALPMVLPSGKIVDSSTLLKHTEHEEKWGRLPSDPFTGQPYTEIHKPVLDSHLKSQIDSFLLRNCDAPEISNTARTVGPISKRRRVEFTYSYVNGDLNTIRTELSSNSKKDASSSITTQIPQVPSTSLMSSTSTSTLIDTMSQRKIQSLDEAIRGVLKVAKYTATSHTNRLNNTSIDQCFQCCDSVINMLYKITTCAHLICRNCLIDKNLKTCKCGKIFSNIDVNKYH